MNTRGEMKMFVYIFLSYFLRNCICFEPINEHSNNCKIISCGSDQSIDITYAYYGVQYRCDASNEVEVLNGKCSGKQSCEICATNSWFGDPCVGTHKYLWYNFACKHIDDCLQGPCRNNGTCTDLVNDYQCDCVAGFNGKNCESNVDECLSQPCKNNGTCVNLINDYKCLCVDGFNGTICTNNFLQILNFESSSSVVHEGDSVWFKSQIRSKTMYEVQWFHHGYLITNSSRRYKMTSSKTEKNTYLHILLIANVLHRDMGAWEIRMSYHVTHASRNLTLTVFPRLILFMNPKYNFSILMGDEMNVQCTVTNPESLSDVTNGSLVITKDGSVLQETSSLNLSTTWNKYSAVEADSGRYTCTHSGYHVPVSVSVYVTVIQPEQKRCESEWSEGVQWKATLAGTTKQEPCPAKQKGSAKRYCEPLGVWASPSLINCTSEAFTNVSLLLDVPIEDGIQDTKMVQDKVNNAIQTMKNLTSPTSELSAGDLSSSLDILEKIVDLTNSTGSIIEKEKVFYGVIDNVLSANNSKSWKTVSEKTVKDGSSILKNVDRLSEIVIQRNNITATHFMGSNYELTIHKTKIDETGIRFPDVPTENISGSSEQISTFLELPEQETKVKKEIYYVAIIYKTISDILPSELDKDQSKRSLDHTSEEKKFVNSPVVSLTTQNDLGLLVPPLHLSFGHIKNESSKMYAVCVSWNFTVNKWTEKGCKVSQSDHKRTVCQCNHLTNFAILMRPYSPATEDKQLLKTMSLVGVILSISFTALTCVIYILTWRYIKSDQNIIMMNLCGSLILSYVIFSSAVEQIGHEGICSAITAIMHYFFLVTFFSMLGMGVYYFMSITVTYYAMYVANNFKARSRVHWFLLAIWGIPIILTTATLGAFWGKGYHLESFCWLSPDSGSLYMFIVPVCLISVLNVVIIVTLVRVLCVSKAMAKSSLQKKASSALRSLGTLLPVLGVTWLFGILAVNEKADVFQYIFVIANSLQGFFIFISHVLLNQKVMQGLRNKYPALSTLASKDEHSKIETTSVSRSQSTCKPDASLVETKKQSIFDKTHNKKVKKSESFIAETTLATDCPLSTGHDKNSVLPDIYK